LSQVKVLIVDDEADFASALSERLRLRNCDSQAVFRAEDALAIIRSGSYEVVLLDFDMPGINGIEVLKTIKQTNPTIEVIMLTGGGNIKNVEEVIQIGAFDYFMKPIDIEELTISINNAKRKKRY
jgi:two-component system, OmpR family, response regulator CpxR